MLKDSAEDMLFKFLFMPVFRHFPIFGKQQVVCSFGDVQPA